jgi:hypothetical protein
MIMIVTTATTATTAHGRHDRRDRHEGRTTKVRGRDGSPLVSATPIRVLSAWNASSCTRRWRIGYVCRELAFTVCRTARPRLG